MARAATTTDAFNAVAEPRRREILDLLAAGERPVNELVRAARDIPAAGFQAPAGAQGGGGGRGARGGKATAVPANGRALKPIYDWVKGYERFVVGAVRPVGRVLEELKEERRRWNDGE